MFLPSQVAGLQQNRKETAKKTEVIVVIKLDPLKPPKRPAPTTTIRCETEERNKMVSTFSCPATKALELQQHKTTVSKRSTRERIESKLSCELFSLNFENNVNAFPVIEWDSNDDSDSLSDSSSVRSMESWNSGSVDTDCSLGKRGRSKSKTSYRRLVRSKKIKSDLASLARNIPAN